MDRVFLAAIAGFIFGTLTFAAIVLIRRASNKTTQRQIVTKNRTRPVTNVDLSSTTVVRSFDPDVQITMDELAKATKNFSPELNVDLSSTTVDSRWSFDPDVQITMDELAKATKNFSPEQIVGGGGFGLVYKARLSNGLVVAIKKLSPDAFQGFREFRAEMETLGKLRHPNIVNILGYWASGCERLLVYEFIERGNLGQRLHCLGNDDVSNERLPLSWETRTKIVRGVANGLCYLHRLGKPIIHRDIKPSNVLLDSFFFFGYKAVIGHTGIGERIDSNQQRGSGKPTGMPHELRLIGNVLLDSEFEAHIADFGLARSIDTSHSHVSTEVAGTEGYMPPEYRDGVNVANVKVDVYSFGVLMLEIGTGHRPNLPVIFYGNDIGLVQWARQMVDQSAEMEMVDHNISREGISEASVGEYFRIANLCTSEFQKERPVMPEVAEMLDKMPA